MQISIKVTPRAKENKIEKISANEYRVRLTARPIDGKANKALAKLLAKEFKVAKSCIEITKGANNRNKIVRIG